MWYLSSGVKFWSQSLERCFLYNRKQNPRTTMYITVCQFRTHVVAQVVHRCCNDQTMVFWQKNKNLPQRLSDCWTTIHKKGKEDIWCAHWLDAYFCLNRLLKYLNRVTPMRVECRQARRRHCEPSHLLKNKIKSFNKLMNAHTHTKWGNVPQATTTKVHPSLSVFKLHREWPSLIGRQMYLLVVVVVVVVVRLLARPQQSAYALMETVIIIIIITHRCAPWLLNLARKV